MLILFYLKSSMTELADHQGQAFQGHALNDVANGLPDLGWCSKGDVPTDGSGL
jgi:hypothetical protein